MKTDKTRRRNAKPYTCVKCGHAGETVISRTLCPRCTPPKESYADYLSRVPSMPQDAHAHELMVQIPAGYLSEAEEQRLDAQLAASMRAIRQAHLEKELDGEGVVVRCGSRGCCNARRFASHASAAKCGWRVNGVVVCPDCLRAKA